MVAKSSRPRLRILVVTTSLAQGGAERVVSHLLTHLDRGRFHVHACLFRHLLHYPVPSDTPITLIPKTSAAALPRAVLRLRSLIRTLQPDVILGAASPNTWLVHLALLGFRNPPPVIARIAVDPSFHASSTDRYLQPVVNHFLRRSYRFVVNCGRLGQRLAAALSIPAERVSVIENPVDFELVDHLAEVSIPEEHHSRNPTIVWVGRLETQKRPDLIIRAFRSVRSELDSRLWICGDGSLRQAVEADARTLGLAEDVSVLGFDPNPYRWMARADVLVLTSDFEGSPSVIAEALSLGTPVVSARCPTGPDELIRDGVDGFLVPTGDSRPFAQRIQQLLLDPALRQTMGRAARATARRRFRLQPIMEQWQTLFLESAGASDP